MLAGVGGQGIVIIYDLSSGQELYSFEVPAEVLLAVTWSADSRRIAVSGTEPFIFILCVDQQTPAQCTPGNLITSIEAHEPYVLDVDWSPDGTKLASVNQIDQALSVWDANKYKLINTLHRGDPYKVEWSPDSTELAIVNLLGGAWIVDASLDRSTIRAIGPTEEPVEAVEWSPNGLQLAIGIGYRGSGENQGGVYILDAVQGNVIANFQNLGDMVTDVSWSPDGTRLASYSTDKNIRIWDVTNQQLLAAISTVNETYISSHSITWDRFGNTVIYGGGETQLPIGLATPITIFAPVFTNTKVLPTVPPLSPMSTSIAPTVTPILPTETQFPVATWTLQSVYR